MSLVYNSCLSSAAWKDTLAVIGKYGKAAEKRRLHEGSREKDSIGCSQDSRESPVPEVQERRGGRVCISFPQPESSPAAAQAQRASYLLLSAFIITGCAMLLLLAGCASQSQTFNERLAAGYSAATGALSTTRFLLDAKKISSADAENVVQQADIAKKGLDVARAMYKTNPQAAENKIAAQRAILKELRDYLLLMENK